jgi:hypothetical protein
LDSNRESEIVLPLATAFVVVVLAVCVFFWVGTSFSVGADRQFLNAYSAIAAVLFVLTSAATYRVLKNLSKTGKENDLAWLLVVMVVSPVFLLGIARDAGSGGFIAMAGYFGGLLFSEAVFSARTRWHKRFAETKLSG